MQIKTIEDLKKVILAGMIELDASFTKDWRHAKRGTDMNTVYEVLGTVELNFDKFHALQETDRIIEQMFQGL